MPNIYRRAVHALFTIGQVLALTGCSGVGNIPVLGGISSMETVSQIACLGRAAEKGAKTALARFEQEPTDDNLEMLSRAVEEWEQAVAAWSAALAMDVSVAA
jgi:hypothetical protein